MYLKDWSFFDEEIQFYIFVAQVTIEGSILLFFLN
jgi:hypothetical protein